MLREMIRDVGKTPSKQNETTGAVHFSRSRNLSSDGRVQDILKRHKLQVGLGKKER